MRALVDPTKIRQMMREIGRRSRGPGRIYLVGEPRYPALDATAFELRVRRFLADENA